MFVRCKLFFSFFVVFFFVKGKRGLFNVLLYIFQQGINIFKGIQRIRPKSKFFFVRPIYNSRISSLTFIGVTVAVMDWWLIRF